MSFLKDDLRGMGSFYTASAVGSESSKAHSLPEKINSRFFKIGKEGQGLSSTLEINLLAYIESYYQEDKDQYHLFRAQLIQQVTGFDATVFWPEMLEAILQDKIYSEEIARIKSSPASVFMEESFIELVKNGMDEIILAYQFGAIQASLKLTLDIDLSQKDCIKLTISDNGRGFPSSFLLKIASIADKEKYIEGKGSVKNNAIYSEDELEEESLPHLFGGAGRGLRILMARVLEGDSLIPGGCEPKFIKPEISKLDFRNGLNGQGAIIEITTSLKPLQLKTFLRPSRLRSWSEPQCIEANEPPTPMMRPMSSQSMDSDSEEEIPIVLDLPQKPTGILILAEESGDDELVAPSPAGLS